jgi:hypothetical protein
MDVNRLKPIRVEMIRVNVGHVGDRVVDHVALCRQPAASVNTVAAAIALVSHSLGVHVYLQARQLLINKRAQRKPCSSAARQCTLLTTEENTHAPKNKQDGKELAGALDNTRVSTKHACAQIEQKR